MFRSKEHAVLGGHRGGSIGRTRAFERLGALDSQCDPEVVERLEAHVAYLGREVALEGGSLASVETATLRHDAALLDSLDGSSAHIDADGDLVLSGINLRLVGNEAPSEPANGKGNLWGTERPQPTSRARTTSWLVQGTLSPGTKA